MRPDKFYWWILNPATLSVARLLQPTTPIDQVGALHALSSSGKDHSGLAKVAQAALDSDLDDLGPPLGSPRLVRRARKSREPDPTFLILERRYEEAVRAQKKAVKDILKNREELSERGLSTTLRDTLMQENDMLRERLTETYDKFERAREEFKQYKRDTNRGRSNRDEDDPDSFTGWPRPARPQASVIAQVSRSTIEQTPRRQNRRRQTRGRRSENRDGNSGGCAPFWKGLCGGKREAQRDDLSEYSGR